MIKLTNIPDLILNKHWNYFIQTNGYKKITTFSEDHTLRPKEMNLYTELKLNSLFLKKLVCGTPDELSRCIDKFMKLVNGLPELRFAQLPNYKVIYQSINTKNGLKPEERLNNKKSILQRLVDIDKLCVIENVYDNAIFNEDPSSMDDNQFTISKIKSLYKELKNKLASLYSESSSRLCEVFNYDAFASSFDNWGAYHLTTSLGVSVCPYCNLNYVHTIETENGKTRPELDHFYPKSKFPFLALSIYNLIPSCHICNSNFKGSIDFHTKIHINPYGNELLKKFEFFVDVNDSDMAEAVPEIEDFKIIMKTMTENESEILRIKNSIQTFKLIELYNNHKEIAKEILEKALYYNETRIIELSEFFDDELADKKSKDIKLDESTKRFILGNFVEDSKIGKRTLSKFMRDVAMGTDLKKYL
ncbi:HNH endonuclease [Brumimicrobium oceani]|uniref:HNH nuclease domain-containing protein n=1 Tax=Brumimicrobium oceani TaxID=2100725 RepID=A0A2U2XC91_9FLAO|nr:hypothetical protein [Brumimicrobium oceani]PWH85415.1 hypothetical protein DIT68_09140 [Brumimicrobium oceani]